MRASVGAVALVFLCGGALAQAQTTLRLPLPVDTPPNAAAFDAPAPSAAVLTGFLWPAAGALTAWAPVYSTLGADGALTEVQAGGWVGPRPERWLKVVKKGYVVGGFRVLVRTAPAPVQTRQVQIFWRPWVGGLVGDPVVTSQVYGAPAGPTDTVRIVELRLPPGAVPTGLYGQTVTGAVAQASLLVKSVPPPPGDEAVAQQGPASPAAPTVLSVPTVRVPALK